MKILLIITKGDSGGAQMSVLNLARELKNRGHELLVGLGVGNFLPGELERSGITCHRFKYLKRTHNPLANILFIFEIKKFLKDAGIEVVHFNSSNSLFGAIGAKLFSRNIKTIFTFRGMSILDEHHEINFLLKKIYFYFFKFCLKFIDTPVFVSRENLDKARDLGLVKDGKLIYNGLDPDKLEFLDREAAQKYLVTEFNLDLAGKFVIGSIGRLVYVKNYEFLINIFPKILKIRPDACLLVIGEGERREKYLKMLKFFGLEDKIFFVGEIKNAYRFIKAFDLFVLPSRYEGLSITLIESLMAGVPVLASYVGGNRETVANEGEIYELNNEGDFLEKFKKLSQKNSLENLDQIKSRQAEKFHIKNTVDAYENCYQK